MNKIAVLIFESGRIWVVRGVCEFEIEVKYEDCRQRKYIKLKGFEHNYNYIHTFFDPILSFMLFDNEEDLVFENDKCVGWKEKKYFDEERMKNNEY